MAKAYDSVSLTPLKRVLLRLQIPLTTVNLLIDLFEQRQIKIITAYGATDFITGHDGIDQGETISPLLWRIFYDPLLYLVQKRHKGYSMIPHPTIPLHDNLVPFNSSNSAYIDDTLWLGSNKHNIQ